MSNLSKRIQKPMDAKRHLPQCYPRCMTKTFEAVYDGKVLLPEEPLDLRPNTRVRITVETGSVPEGEPYSFLRIARSLNLEGPPDWSGSL